MQRLFRLYLLNTLGVTIALTKNMVTIPNVGALEGCTAKTAWTNKTIYQFLGVPYAESPSKQLRFKPPVRRAKWEGVRDATKFGPPCPSAVRKVMPGESKPDDPEDCLNLCIYTGDLKSKAAVLVYVHGGGFIQGSAADFSPSYLLEKDVVLVVPQYRLGVFGFLSTGTADIPGNMAAMDLKLALEWIQDNISYFGGDPCSVTLIGQSAGAALVTGLMISPCVPPNLFHKVIIQSGAITCGWSICPDSILVARKICQKLGCEDCDPDAMNKCLMDASVSNLLEISILERGPNLIMFSLTSDDYYNFFPMPLSELIANTKKCPMIAGVTKHEGSMALRLAYDFLKKSHGSTQFTPQNLIDLLILAVRETDLSGVIVNMAKELFFKSMNLNKMDTKNMIPGLIDLAGMLTIKSPVLRFAQHNAEKHSPSTYFYTFDYLGEHTFFAFGGDKDSYPFKGGVHHSDDNLYTIIFRELNDRDAKIAKTMVEFWTSFAIHGAPEVAGVTKWNPISESLNGPYLHINENCKLGSDFMDEFLVTVNDPCKCCITKD